jgi:hypothetical protein
MHCVPCKEQVSEPPNPADDYCPPLAHSGADLMWQHVRQVAEAEPWSSDWRQRRARVVHRRGAGTVVDALQRPVDMERPTSTPRERKNKF